MFFKFLIIFTYILCIPTTVTLLYFNKENIKKYPDSAPFVAAVRLYFYLYHGFAGVLKLIVALINKANGVSALEMAKVDLSIGYGAVSLCGILPQLLVFFLRDPRVIYSVAAMCNYSVIMLYVLFISQHLCKYEVLNPEESNWYKWKLIVLQIACSIIASLFTLVVSSFESFVTVLQMMLAYNLFYSAAISEFCAIQEFGIRLKGAREEEVNELEARPQYSEWAVQRFTPRTSVRRDFGQGQIIRVEEQTKFIEEPEHSFPAILKTAKHVLMDSKGSTRRVGSVGSTWWWIWIEGAADRDGRAGGGRGRERELVLLEDVKMQNRKSKKRINPQRDQKDNAKMSKEGEDDVNFQPGVEIVSHETNYTILKLIGEGGFGAVYLVEDDKSKQYAMKVERKIEDRTFVKLQMEIAVLKVANGKHFTKMVDRGKKDEEGFFFLVMELVGKSLSDLKADRAENVFSFVTGLGVANQCLEAVEELHKYGFIHRDLKPQNYACGLDEKQHLIYILDFGIARKYVNTKNELKIPRESVVFKGTVRFASITMHRNAETAPKDDVESWFYLLIDLILVGGLPWKKLNDRNEVLKMKEECRKEKRSFLYTGIKQTSELNKVLDYIDSRAYADRLDYQFIYKSLAIACTATGMDIDSPYDWETTEETEE